VAPALHYNPGTLLPLSLNEKVYWKPSVCPEGWELPDFHFIFFISSNVSGSLSDHFFFLYFPLLHFFFIGIDFGFIFSAFRILLK
jgi:hypothetical protein